MDQKTRRRQQPVLRKLLRQLRKEAGLRQQDLAIRLGRPQSFVSKYEIGDRRLDVLELRQVCMVMGVPLTTFIKRLEQLLKGDDE